MIRKLPNGAPNSTNSKYYYLIRSELINNDNTTRKVPNGATVTQFFKKKFQFRKQLQWKLPLIHSTFQGNEGNKTVPQLQWIKSKLNDVKDQLNDIPLDAWSKFTAKRDPSSAISWYIRTEIKAEFVTKAWCKMFECVNAYPILKVQNHGDINSVSNYSLPMFYIQ